MVTTPQSEAQDRFSNFDFYTGETFVGGTVGVKTDWSNIQPRIGFAWSPSGSTNTVIRGGYGIYHDVSAMGGSTGPYQNPPYANAYAFTSDNITPVRTLATGFPDNSQPVDPANYRGDWTTIDPNFKQGRVQQWSVNVERQLPFSTIAQHRLCRQLRRSAVRQEPQPQHGDAGAGLQPGGPAPLSRSCRRSSPPSAAAG